ncbi:Uncharacterised protein [Mycobacteroides abscessus subsp. abscessus]|nr:Uncharacterised protein [Mycobacteroides abscessus subsp. abscessus]
MKSAVSTPSRPTDKKATVKTASAPASSAWAMPWRRSPAMLAAAVRIHSTMVVTMATATSEATPAMASAPRSLMVLLPRWIVRKMISVIATAPATPSHTQRSASRRLDFTRNATRIITTIPHSSPSRSPMRPLLKYCEKLVGPSARTPILRMSRVLFLHWTLASQRLPRCG